MERHVTRENKLQARTRMRLVVAALIAHADLGTVSDRSPDTVWHQDRPWHCFDSDTD